MMKGLLFPAALVALLLVLVVVILLGSFEDANMAQTWIVVQDPAGHQVDCLLVRYKGHWGVTCDWPGRGK